ncbi:hypothetical protein DVW64_11840 [Enterococcus faecium]|nr:hypothetical protein DVW64_11840 [Enterococcus faecium]
MPFIYKNTRHSNKKVTRGGTLFSVGSDGHYLEHFRFHFDDLFALLKANGVTELAIYQKGKRIMVPLQSKKTSSASKVRTFF